MEVTGRRLWWRLPLGGALGAFAQHVAVQSVPQGQLALVDEPELAPVESVAIADAGVGSAIPNEPPLPGVAKAALAELPKGRSAGRCRIAQGTDHGRLQQVHRRPGHRWAAAPVGPGPHAPAPTA